MKPENDLYAHRRHLRACQFFGRGGREARTDRCNCPFHADGKRAGKRVRQSLRTRSRQLADRRLGELIRKLDEEVAKKHADPLAAPATAHQRTLSEAVQRYLKTHGEIDPEGKYRGDSEYGTFRKYRGCLTRLVSFCDGRRVTGLIDVDPDALEDFRGTRAIELVTWKVERQMLVTFFGYCARRKWITTNPAKELKAPHNPKPKEVVPYTLQEESQILEACTQIGGGRGPRRSGTGYEHLRARAMVMLLRNTALRISDVSTFRKDAVSWDQAASTWRIFLRTQKTGEPVFLPIPDSLKMILDALPLPRNAARDCPYYFWNGVTSRRGVVGIAERTLAAVFKKSGVKNAHAHRYRHTLATRLLEQGASFEQVADILGNTPAVVRKHYGKWSKGRQDNIDRLMIAHFQTMPVTSPVTLESHEKTEAIN